MSEEKIVLDVAGYDIITNALQSLLDGFPGLFEGETIVFTDTEKETGIAWYVQAGGIIEKQKENIVGEVTQDCTYPFCVVYRAGNTPAKRKVTIKEFLDSLGCWLERQPVKINGENVQLREYPALTGSRKIMSVKRQTSAYLNDVSEDKTEEWIIYLALNYKNEFTR